MQRAAAVQTSDSQRGRADRELLELVVANLNDAVLITEGEAGSTAGRRILFVNRAFTELTGYSAEEALDRTPDLTIGPDTDRAALRRIAAARAALVPIREEVLKYRKDGSTVWVELDVIPVIGENGRCSHFMGVMRDITERKTLAARLVEADRLATLGTLVGAIGHEINNPLTYVIGNLDFVAQSLSATPQHDLLSAIREAQAGAERVRSIVADLRGFSRADPSKLTIIDPRKVLRATLTIGKKTLESKATITDRALGSSLVRAPEALLGQLFLNILLYAAHALPQAAARSNRIVTEAHDTDTKTVIDIAFSGAGVSPEVSARIFDARLSSAAVDLASGLGLRIASDIAVALGGGLQIDNDAVLGGLEGRFSRFRITLPRHDGAATAAQPVAAAARGRLLLVDDDAAVGNALRRLLGSRHDVELASGGREAIDILTKVGAGAFDAILCDLMMPGVDGTEVYEFIRAAAPGSEARVVFMTGGVFTDEIERFLNSVPNLRMEKPIDRATLLAAIAKLVDDR